MRRAVFKPDDADRSYNSALFGGTVSDSGNALAIFWYSTQTISPNEADPRWPLTIAVIPFVILIYFGSAFIISDTIYLGAASLTTTEEELSFPEGLAVIVTYVALSGWLWLRWHPITPDKQKNHRI